MDRGARPLLLAIALLVGACPWARAFPAGSPVAREALEICQRASEPGAGDGRVEALTRGLALAEDALRHDEKDGLAHFALFCNLARRLQVMGAFTRPFDMLYALRVLDRAVALAPADPDVLTAKGALLIELPRLLGGDTARGEELLRRALAVDPQHDAARRYLAAVLAARGGAPEPPADDRRVAFQ